ncbi:MAG: TonB-dependent receptor plug domain-containing protein, partial [Bacteroidia bacterium]
PFNNQWNYTIGGAVKRLVKDGFVNVALSRNMMFNSLDRFENGDNGNEAKRLLKLRSHEIENKFRADVNKYTKGWKYSYGISAQYVKYDNDFYSRIRRELRDSAGNLIQPGVELNFNTGIKFFKMGAFAEVNRRVFNERLGITFGIRNDMNTFTNNGLNPLKTLSPRASLSYALTEKWNLNATSGMYYKLPVYTVLGYKDQAGNFINKDNDYIRVNHYVAGLEYLPTNSARITLEGFYKVYGNYPVSARDGISLANQGGDFGAIGNERTISNGKGRTYGAELFFQQKLTKKIFATVSYTFVRSEFSGKDPDKYIPSAWDTRHLVSALAGYKFGKGWEAGAKYRFASGAPYTPFAENASRANYLSLGTGILDYGNYNSQRLQFYNQLDVRVSKKYNFKKWSLDLYVDVQNITLNNNPAYPQYTFKRLDDNSDWFTTDGNAVKPDGSNAVPLILSNESALVTPTFGFVVEF